MTIKLITYTLLMIGVLNSQSAILTVFCLFFAVLMAIYIVEDK